MQIAFLAKLGFLGQCFIEYPAMLSQSEKFLYWDSSMGENYLWIGRLSLIWTPARWRAKRQVKEITHAIEGADDVLPARR